MRCGSADVCRARHTWGSATERLEMGARRWARRIAILLATSVPHAREHCRTGPRIQVDADRAGVGARGEQVECRVVGGRSCVEAVVGFEFYCMERVCASRQELVSSPDWGDFQLRRCAECAS